LCVRNSIRINGRCAMGCLKDEIAQVEAKEMDSVLKAVLDRYKVLFPDWTVSTVSVQTSLDRREQLDRMINLLEKMKELPD